jgi:pantothenate kinase-related protein Tda10
MQLTYCTALSVCLSVCVYVCLYVCLYVCMSAAGTHDLPLLRRTLSGLRAAGSGDCVRVPRYDKSLRGGRGDRAAPDAWTTVTGQ